ncbi:hypothetical protein GGI04_001163 [Coemansia thaxteri]|nr:hypothetical protein GGI04_001163 [Coemansia thaxteri]KAJ2485943.1 hypothetical protein EV174_001404 [Coemansia sp. RSA 2320]
MSTSHGNYSQAPVSTACFAPTSAGNFPITNSDSFTVDPQGHLAALAASHPGQLAFAETMSWNQHESIYSPESTTREYRSNNVHLGGQSMFFQQQQQGLAIADSTNGKRDRVNSRGVRKPEAEYARSASPGSINNGRGGSSGAGSHHSGDDDDGADAHNVDSSGNASVEQQRRNRFLERNRVAASKCRQKKKVWIQELERRAENATMQNRSLHIAIAQLKEEVIILKSQLLTHRNCQCTMVHQYLHSDTSSSIDPAQAMAAAVSATGGFPMVSQQQHMSHHPPAGVPSLGFYSPPHKSMMYQTQPPEAYHHQSVSTEMSSAPNRFGVTPSPSSPFTANMDSMGFSHQP